MKLCLIHPSDRFMEDPKYFRPIGLPSLVAYLQQVCQIEVVVVDLADKDMPEEGDVPDADVYGVGFVSCQVQNVRQVVVWLREHRPGRLIIGGGIDVTMRTALALQDFDYVVCGEGEVAGANLVRALCETANARPAQRVWSAPPGDLTTFPIPAYDVLPGYARYLLQTWRSCMFDCAFCAQKAMWPGQARFFTLEWVERTVRRFMVGQEIVWIDEMMTFRPKRAERIACILCEHGVTWRGQTRADMLVSVEYLKQMQKYGCHDLALGIESGSQRILDMMDKQITVEQLKRGMRMVQEAGIRLRTYIIRGYPGETEADWELTMSMLLEIKPDSIRVFDFVPLPGSRSWTRGERGRLGEEDAFGHAAGYTAAMEALTREVHGL
jgi:radical SAM superfamily enzyme YgiQ (UPF0313 family)